LGQQKKMKVIIATLLFISAAGAIRNLVGLPEERSSRLHHLLKDGPIDAKKLSNPYNSKTIDALADLFEKYPLNDDSASDESGSGSGVGGSGSSESGSGSSESASGSSESGSGSSESGSGSSESGSGFVEGSSGFVESGSGMEPDTLKALVKSLLKIGPALEELKEKRDERIAKTGSEFIAALKEYKDDDEILQLLGRHVIEEHKECDDVKHKFADYVHKSVLYELLEGQDTLNFQQNLAYVLEAAKMSPEFDAFEAFSYMTALYGLQDHPGIKAIMVIGGLVAEAACDEKLDGLFNKFGELIKEHGPHGDIDFASRINLDLYMDNSKVCKRGLVKRIEPPQVNIKDRVLDLMFKGYQPHCDEVKIIRFAVETVLHSIEVSRKFAWLHAISKGHEHVVISHVKYFLEHGHEDVAHKIVGEYVLANVRGAMTVGLAVEKRFKP